jgi:hypothetical protein
MNPRTEKLLLTLAAIVVVVMILRVLTIIERMQVYAATPPQEVAPYLAKETPSGTRIYKTVHQGCELYIAENIHTQFNYADTVAVSITTGRGCK